MSETQNIRVVCRVRPSNEQEVSSGGKVCVIAKGKFVEIDMGDGKPAQRYQFDHTFNETSSQQSVFELVAAPMVKELLNGYNSTIFAYGQTSSGKTYTMTGPDLDGSSSSAGIIPRTAKALFSSIDADPQHDYAVSVSFIEIYMEKVRDLLDSASKESPNLVIRVDPSGGFYVQGVEESTVVSAEDILRIVRDGSKNRTVAATLMNEASSRSHSIFTITMRKMNTEKADKVVKGKVNPKPIPTTSCVPSQACHGGSSRIGAAGQGGGYRSQAGAGDKDQPVADHPRQGDHCSLRGVKARALQRVRSYKSAV